MPYIHVIDGQCLTLDVKKDVYDESRAIEAHPDFKALKEKAEAAGLQVIVTRNVDDDQICIALGLELYEDRHIFQGLTVTCPGRATSDQRTQIGELFTELTVTLATLGYEGVVEQGLVISQFD